MSFAEIGDECLIGAGTLITKKMKIPPRSLVMGSPGKVVRSVTLEELAFFPQSAANYVADGIEYRGIVSSPGRVGSHDSDLELFTDDMPDNMPDNINDDPDGMDGEGR